MNTYWLSRNGAAAEGPFAQSQIISMWARGQFTAADQLCEVGAQDWQPASYVMHFVDLRMRAVAPPPVPLRPVAELWDTSEPEPERTDWGNLLLALLTLAVCVPIGIYLYVHPHARPTFSGGLQPKVNVRERGPVQAWVAASFADKFAEAFDVGSPLAWKTGHLRLVRVRAKIGPGAASIRLFVLQMADGDREVLASWPAKDWLKLYGQASPDPYPATTAAVREADRLEG